MKFSEYVEKAYALDREHKANLRKLTEEYVKENSKYAIGDTVKDHYKCIVIEKVHPYISMNGKPACAYTGIVLNKNGKLAKRQIDNVVYSCNVIGGWEKEEDGDVGGKEDK